MRAAERNGDAGRWAVNRDGSQAMRVVDLSERKLPPLIWQALQQAETVAVVAPAATAPIDAAPADVDATSTDSAPASTGESSAGVATADAGAASTDDGHDVEATEEGSSRNASSMDARAPQVLDADGVEQNYAGIAGAAPEDHIESAAAESDSLGTEALLEDMDTLAKFAGADADVAGARHIAGAHNTVSSRKRPRSSIASFFGGQRDDGEASGGTVTSTGTGAGAGIGESKSGSVQQAQRESAAHFQAKGGSNASLTGMLRLSAGADGASKTLKSSAGLSRPAHSVGGECGPTPASGVGGAAFAPKIPEDDPFCQTKWPPWLEDRVSVRSKHFEPDHGHNSPGAGAGVSAGTDADASTPPRIVLWVTGCRRTRDNCALGFARWLGYTLQLPIQAVALVHPSTHAAAKAMILRSHSSKPADKEPHDAEYTGRGAAFSISALAALRCDLAALDIPLIALIAHPHEPVMNAGVGAQPTDVGGGVGYAQAVVAWCDVVATHLLIADGSNAPVFSAAFDQLRHMAPHLPFLSVDPTSTILPSSWGQGQGQGQERGQASGLVDFQVYRRALEKFRDADKYEDRLGNMGLLLDHLQEGPVRPETQRCLYQREFSCATINAGNDADADTQTAASLYAEQSKQPAIPSSILDFYEVVDWRALGAFASSFFPRCSDPVPAPGVASPLSGGPGAGLDGAGAVIRAWGGAEKAALLALDVVARRGPSESTCKKAVASCEGLFALLQLVRVGALSPHRVVRTLRNPSPRVLHELSCSSKSEATANSSMYPAPAPAPIWNMDANAPWLMLVVEREYSIYILVHHLQTKHGKWKSVSYDSFRNNTLSSSASGATGQSVHGIRPVAPLARTIMDQGSEWRQMLPQWVRGELITHAGDDRPSPGPYLPADLEYGRTHDRLFNVLAERLRHDGALHVEPVLLGYFLQAAIMLSADPMAAINFAITQLECHALAGGGRSENAPDMVPWLFIHGLQALVKAVPTAQVNAQGAPVMGRLWHFKVKNVKNALGESRL